jgi:hypothetical protein
MSAAGEDVIPELKSSVRIEQNAKGTAQAKICVYAGTTEDEMERISALAHKTYTDLLSSLGVLGKF